MSDNQVAYNTESFDSSKVSKEISHMEKQINSMWKSDDANVHKDAYKEITLTQDSTGHQVFSAKYGVKVSTKYEGSG